MKIERHSASAELAMHDDGLLVVRLAGPLTADVLAYFKRHIVAHHGSQIKAYLADYSRATIALSGADLDAVLEGEADDSAPTMPAALVVPEMLLPLFREHARRMVRHRIVRRVFLSHAEGMAWARRQAALAVR